MPRYFALLVLLMGQSSPGLAQSAPMPPEWTADRVEAEAYRLRCVAPKMSWTEYYWLDAGFEGHRYYIDLARVRFLWQPSRGKKAARIFSKLPVPAPLDDSGAGLSGSFDLDTRKIKFDDCATRNDGKSTARSLPPADRPLPR